MLTKKQQRYTLSLMLLALSCLSSCTMANYNNYCPIYPVAGKPVYEELKTFHTKDTRILGMDGENKQAKGGA